MIELALNEKAIIWRKRNKFMQSKAADYFGIKHHHWKYIEYGKMQPNSDIIASIDLIKPTPNEACAIVRKRRKLTQREFAKKLGISRQYLNMIENGRAIFYFYEIFDLK